MAKTLRVIDPFFIMELGDLFEYSEADKMYISKHSEEFYKNGKETVDNIKSSFNSEFSISVDYAKTLIDEGYLEEVSEVEKNSFVNIFDEIDNLLIKYNKGLSTLDKDYAELPACVKIEKKTVLENLITLLEHLKSLKK